ncbi:hypothetical protein D9M71_412550 [compost metagenome]
MHRATVAEQLPIDTGRIHLILEGRQLLLGHQWVACAMQHQHRTLDVLRIRWVWRVQSAMERHCRLERCAGARQLQGAAAAEAETKGGQLRLVDRSLALPFQLLQGCLHALAQFGTVVLEWHHRRTRLVGVLRPYGLAVNVGNQHHITLGGHGLGDTFGTCANAHPVGRHQQPRARRRNVGVEHQAAFIRLTVDLVQQRFNSNRTHLALPSLDQK